MLPKFTVYKYTLKLWIMWMLDLKKTIKEKEN